MTACQISNGWIGLGISVSSCTVSPRSGMPGIGIWKCLPWNENDLLGERPTDDLHRLLEDLTVVEVGGDLVGVVHRADRHALVVEVQHLAGHGAPPDAEHASPARQVVQRGEVLGQAQRVPLRHDVEHRAEPQRGGLSGDPGRDQQPVGDHLVALVLEVVLGGPERVEPEPFGLLGGVDVVERRLPALVVGVATIHRSGRAGPASSISTPPKKKAPSFRSGRSVMAVASRRCPAPSYGRRRLFTVP